MLSGRRLDLLDPAPLDVEIEDIAQGLSRVARWNGQTLGEWAFTVAQHSILVEQLVGELKPTAPTTWRLAALLHDSPEYVIGDLISPFKAAVGMPYKDLEHRLMRAILLRYGLPGELPAGATALIKRADRAAAYLEAIELAGFSPLEARRYFGRPRVIERLERGNLPLTPWAPAEAKTRFLDRFQELTRDETL